MVKGAGYHCSFLVCKIPTFSYSIRKLSAEEMAEEIVFITVKITLFYI